MWDCWNISGIWGDTENTCPELDRVTHCKNCELYAAFGRLQLDRDPDSEYLQEWTEILSRDPGKIEKKEKSAFIFRVGLVWMALPSWVIQEIVDTELIHSLPHKKSKMLLGLVSIRGKLELCFALGALLGIEKEEVKKRKEKYLSPARLIVAEYKHQKVVFPVSQVYGDIKYSKNMLHQLPADVSETRATFASGIICYDEDIKANLLELDILFKSLTKSLL